jgi:hypothetical protein
VPSKRDLSAAPKGPAARSASDAFLDALPTSEEPGMVSIPKKAVVARRAKEPEKAKPGPKPKPASERRQKHTYSLAPDVDGIVQDLCFRLRIMDKSKVVEHAIRELERRTK